MVFQLMHRNGSTRKLTFEKVDVDSFAELLQAAECRALVDNFRICTILSEPGEYLADVMQTREGRMVLYGFPPVAK